MKLLDCNKAGVLLLAVASPCAVFAIDKPFSIFSLEDADRDTEKASTTFVRKLQFFFSPAEWSCRSDLNECVAKKHERGSVNLDKWTVFLDQAYDKEGKPDSVIEKLGSILQQEDSQVSVSDVLDEMESSSIVRELRSVLQGARQVNFADIMDEMKINMDRTEIDDIIASMSELIESAKEQEISLGEVAENDICAVAGAAIEWYSDVIFPFANSLPPVIGDKLFWGGLALFLLKVFVLALPCGHHHEGLPASPFLDDTIAFFDKFTLSARRAFTGTPLLRSSLICEADLLTCEQEEVLANEIPGMLKVAFVNAVNYA